VRAIYQWESRSEGEIETEKKHVFTLYNGASSDADAPFPVPLDSVMTDLMVPILSGVLEVGPIFFVQA